MAELHLSDQALCEHPVAEETCYRGILVQVDHMQVTLPDGRSAMREIVRKNGGAAVVPVDEQGNVYMVRQYRVAFGKVMLEIPAGKLDDANENPDEAAARELEEETGLRAAKMEKLTQIVVSPGFCTEVIDIYLATGLSEHERHLDADEFLHVEKIPLSDLVKSAMRGEITDAKTAVGLFMAWQRLQHV